MKVGRWWKSPNSVYRKVEDWLKNIVDVSLSLQESKSHSKPISRPQRSNEFQKSMDFFLPFPSYFFGDFFFLGFLPTASRFSNYYYIEKLGFCFQLYLLKFSFFLPQYFQWASMFGLVWFGLVFLRRKGFQITTSFQVI